MSNGKREPRATGIHSQLLTAIKNSEGKLVTVEELMKQFPQYTRTKIMSNVLSLMNSSKAGTYIKRIQTGVWRWEDDTTARQEHKSQNVILVEVVREKPDLKIVVDEDDIVYKMTRLG